MGYTAALNKAWDDLEELQPGSKVWIDLMDRSYEINVQDRKIASLSAAPVEDFLAILLLHYLIGMEKKKFSPAGEFVSFKYVEGGAFYYPAFREGVINPILKKFGLDPDRLLVVLDRLNGNRIEEGDLAVELQTFKGIFVRIIIWKADKEFDPEATILFDKNLTNIYSTEDIAVFLRFVVHNL